MKGKSISGWKAWIMLILMLIGAFETGYLVAEIKYEPRIAGLHKQLRRTQYQLKKAKNRMWSRHRKLQNLLEMGDRG